MLEYSTVIKRDNVAFLILKVIDFDVGLHVLNYHAPAAFGRNADPFTVYIRSVAKMQCYFISR